MDFHLILKGILVYKYTYFHPNHAYALRETGLEPPTLTTIGE